MAGGISRRPDAGVAGAGDVGATRKPGVGTENSGPLTEAVGARQLMGGEKENPNTGLEDTNREVTT